MASSGEHPAAAAEGLPAKEAPALPWWTRYMRWRQTSRQEGKDAEYKVMRLFPGPAGPMHASEVPVGPGREDFLHTLSGGQQGVDPPVVLMPGYGAGVGFYYRNFPSLAQRLRLFAVDWLGTGLSGRPAFRAKGREQAEDFFINSLVAWRRAAGLEGSKMILVGHSLGGYLAATYALRYPEHVQHLVLVCPAGVPKAPEDWERQWLGDKWTWRGQLFKVFMKGWESGITPGSIIRGLGPWGQSLVYKYVSNRFSHHGEGLSEREVAVFKQYFYHIAAAPGSGEFALRHLLAPGAWAHSPLEERLHDLQVPVTFIYGKHDWMRPEHAVRLCEQLRAERAPRAAHDLSVEIIDDAGHFVFLDQPELFDKALTAVVAPYLKTATQRSSANAYAAAGTDVHVAPEAGAAAAAAAAGGAPLSGAPATSWGFAAGGAGQAAGARQDEEAVDAEGVQLELGEEEDASGARPAAAGASAAGGRRS
ncbi:hypothetical protein HXX76_016002 [Chlamydomonas incerta]|uniref:AB hydrolase-1 domain-containing protein n=1 Tax=Chlamydomonas incerta TaxID=51695 RepID=A0A835SFI9_CHLIN|nr:hypothetical protein HXX76_016002 [Chlamydomonas incerta]|eukprot:KAG2422478.1 hypothetical protein HXX76_016002 [Chlamydomonas incerta]